MAAAGTNNYGFLEMRSRYLLDCRLTQVASMHIGTGVSGETTDAPFIRQGVTPFVPGSSLRGVMRSTAERMARSLGTGCCVLFDEEAETKCWAGDKTMREKFGKATAGERTQFLRSKDFHLCPICRLFGSTLMAAQLKVGDAAFSNAAKLVRRDGVGIDRDTETAKPKIKYDFEVAEPEAEGALKFTLEIENAGPKEMGVLYIVLMEMERGFSVGGKKSRGLGEVKLELKKVDYFDGGLAGERRYALRKFLNDGYGGFPVVEFRTWLGECFQELLKPEEKAC
jgi:CRISPR-associated protein Csm3